VNGGNCLVAPCLIPWTARQALTRWLVLNQKADSATTVRTFCRPVGRVRLDERPFVARDNPTAWHPH
jgi:hypothetical protein